MILSEPKPIEQIIDSLKTREKIFLIGCGDCATSCKTGGVAETEAMERRLVAEGKEVVGSCVPAASCVAAKLKSELAKHLERLRSADAILVLACGLGVQSVKENDRFGLPVLPGCDTVAGVIVDGKGVFHERCAMCGECMLAFSGGICPIARCSKGLRNGPCGGMDHGKCELDKERDCAWVLVYREMEKRGSLEAFRRIRPPRDHKKSLRPHQSKPM